MTKQASHVVVLKANFLKMYGMKLNVRVAGGSYRDCLALAVPAFRQSDQTDRALLIEIGEWLETHGFYLCQDYGRVGLLSSPSGWTCWNGGVSVLVRYFKKE